MMAMPMMAIEHFPQSYSQFLATLPTNTIMVTYFGVFKFGDEGPDCLLHEMFDLQRTARPQDDLEYILFLLPVVMSFPSCPMPILLLVNQKIFLYTLVCKCRIP